MTMVKTVYLGGCFNEFDIVETFVGSSRKDVVDQLNNYFFDWLHDHSLPQQQLAVLDDWTGSKADHTFYHCNFPTHQWTVWTRCEYVSFK